MLMESRSTDRETLVRRTLQAGTSEMRPETYARFDLHCVFNKLDYEVLHLIAAVHLKKSLALINSQGHAIGYQREVLEYVLREGYSERFGARPMQNAAILGFCTVVASAMLSDGGSGVKGAVCYDRRKNKCFLRLLETAQQSTEEEGH